MRAAKRGVEAVMARIRITFEASPWRNGATRSRRLWRRVGETQDIDAAAIVTWQPGVGWRWFVYQPGYEGASRSGTVAERGPDADRAEAKRQADEALRELAS